MRTKTTFTKPRTQRRLLFQASDHLRHKYLAARLSPDLKASEDIKSIPVRNGDTVRIMRGDQRGFEGKVTRIDKRKFRIYVEGLTRDKADGTTIFLPIHPSKVMIINLNLEDKWRKQIIKRKKEAKVQEKVLKKPALKKNAEKPSIKKQPKDQVKGRKKSTAKITNDSETKKKTTKRSKSRKTANRTKRKRSAKTEGEK